MREIWDAYNEYSHRSVVEKYSNDVSKIGLWKSEEIIFLKYINKSDKILDIGCGAGRTTFALYDLGYKNIIGIDLSEEMITECNSIKSNRNVNIDFLVADATKIPFEDNSFDVCIFSFNGLMTIPKYENRLCAVKEIYRILKSDGKFIFTTHDINNTKFLDYWKAEKEKWEKGIQDNRLYEYGDMIFSKQTEYGDAVCFVHIPSTGEIGKYLDETGFELIYQANRNLICNEKESVKNISDDCIFWIVQKRKEL